MNNDKSKSKIEDDDQILSEVTKSSNTNTPFDTPIDRLTSNERSTLEKPINNSNEAENEQISNETPNVNTLIDNSRKTKCQLVTSIETVNESNKNTTNLTIPVNNKIDPTKLKKGQILSFKIKGNDNKDKILGWASKLQANIRIGLTFHIIYPNTEKGKSGSTGFYDVDILKFIENTEESMIEISNVCYYDAKITELDNWKKNNVYNEVSYHW